MTREEADRQFDKEADEAKNEFELMAAIDSWCYRVAKCQEDEKPTITVGLD